MHSVTEKPSESGYRGLTSVGVQCGSNSGRNPAFTLAAGILGKGLAMAGIRVIYGGVRTGLMGSLADSALESGGSVIGVLPELLVEQGLAHEGLTELRIVHSLAERKSMMLALSDATIILPGGVGTQDEFWEVLAAAQLGYHTKPCGILNVAGYYDSLLRFMDGALAEGFVSANDRQNILVSADPAQLVMVLSQALVSR